MIDPRSIEQLKSTVDIKDVLANYVELKKSGANYKACCPFHGEKTASLVVSPNKQIYHCFGCGKGGDMFNFVQDLKKIDFNDAVEEIAQLCNFTLNYTTAHIKRDISILERYNHLFISALRSSDKAKEYLLKRNIKQETIDEWQLGYGLPTTKQKAQAGEYLFLETELLNANIFGKDGDRIFARFSDRLIFPIHNTNGKIVGWSGRTLSGREDIAKYLNSPQSDVFDKSKLLYGLDKAKSHIAKNKEVIVVEGHIDVVLSHQAGFKNTVGTQGTALTLQHIEALKKYEAFVKLVFDGDKAGFAAAVKASLLLIKAGLNGEVIIMPAGLDPADMIASSSVDKYESMLANNGIDCIRFCLLDIINSHDLSKPHEKSKALDEAVVFLNSTKDKIVANEYKAYLSMLLGINIDLISLDGPIFSSYKEIKDKITLEQTLLYNMTDTDNAKEYREIAREFSHKQAWQDTEAFDELVSTHPNTSRLNRISILDDVVILTKSEFIAGIKTLQRRYLVSLKKRYIDDLNVIADINSKLAKL